MAEKNNLMETVVRAMNREIAKDKIQLNAKSLFEAVKEYDKAIQPSVDAQTRRRAINMVAESEKRLYESYRQHTAPCDCESDTGEMLRAQILSIMEMSEKIYHMMQDSDKFEPWIIKKVTLAEDYTRAIYSYLSYYNVGEMVDPEEWDEYDDDDDDDYDDIEIDDDEIINAIFDSSIDPNSIVVNVSEESK